MMFLMFSFRFIKLILRSFITLLSITNGVTKTISSNNFVNVTLTIYVTTALILDLEDLYIGLIALK